MKKLLRLFLILAAFFAVSCIDSDYDLSKIDTDDLTIGGEGSKFQIPLATVSISTKEIASGGDDIQKILEEANIWLPTKLLDTDSDTGEAYVDIAKLNAGDTVYASALASNLIDQMKTDDTKCNAVAGLIFNKPKYKAIFKPYFPADLDLESFTKVFRAAFRDNTIIQNEAKKLASNYLTLELNVLVQSYTIKDVNLDSNIVDMLTKNLDKPGNSLSIYGEVESKLPVSLSLESPSFSPTDIHFGTIRVAADATSKISHATVTKKDLQQLVNNVEISLPVTLERYYRDKGFKASETKQLIIRLRLEKQGGLDLKL